MDLGLLPRPGYGVNHKPDPLPGAGVTEQAAETCSSATHTSVLHVGAHEFLCSLPALASVLGWEERKEKVPLPPTFHLPSLESHFLWSKDCPILQRCQTPYDFPCCK